MERRASAGVHGRAMSVGPHQIGRLAALDVAPGFAVPVGPLRGGSRRVREGGLEAAKRVEPAGSSGQMAPR